MNNQMTDRNNIDDQLNKDKKAIDNTFIKFILSKMNEDTIESLKNQDNYRSIIKAKMKIEKVFRKE